MFRFLVSSRSIKDVPKRLSQVCNRTKSQNESYIHNDLSQESLVEKYSRNKWLRFFNSSSKPPIDLIRSIKGSEEIDQTMASFLYF